MPPAFFSNMHWSRPCNKRHNYLCRGPNVMFEFGGVPPITDPTPLIRVAANTGCGPLTLATARFVAPARRRGLLNKGTAPMSELAKRASG